MTQLMKMMTLLATKIVTSPKESVPGLSQSSNSKAGSAEKQEVKRFASTAEKWYTTDEYAQAHLSLKASTKSEPSAHLQQPDPILKKQTIDNGGLKPHSGLPMLFLRDCPTHSL